MNLHKLNDRTDAAKWAFPEVEEYYKMGEADSETEKQFDPNVPFEERKKLIKTQEADWRQKIPQAQSEYTKVIEIPGCPEEPEAKTFIIVTKPKKESKKKRPCIISFPCGGMAICFDFFSQNDEFAETFDAVAVTVHYRTIFDEKGGYPGTVNDVHAAYKYVVEHAEELGINPNKIILYGLSSGGQLALAICHRLKKYDYHGYCPRGVIACSPVPDERAIYPSSEFRTKAWGGKQVYLMGYAYMGYEHAYSCDVPAEAFANHATPEECVGLPPTFIHAPENDPCLDPDMQYASKLIQAGVYTCLNVWGGCNHAAMDTAQTQPEFNDIVYAKRWWDTVCSQIRDCIKYDLRRSWIKDVLKED
jgi:acetyl esterase/lipase